MDLKNIDFSDKKVQQVIAIILMGLIISGAIFWLQIKGNNEKLKIANSVRDEKQQELNKILQLKPQLEKLRVSVANLRTKLTALEAVFPDSADTPSLISNITKMARDNELMVVNFKPLGEVVQEYYIEHNYEIELLGAYHKLGTFFEALARYNLIVNVGSLELKPSSVMAADITNYQSLDISEEYDDRVNSVVTKFKLSTYSSKNPTPVQEQP